MALALRAAMYQVTSTAAQLARVEASWARATLASAEAYSSCHQETWVTPR
jgi:hypothetical protein